MKTYKNNDTEDDRYAPKLNATKIMISKMVTEGLREDKNEDNQILYYK